MRGVVAAETSVDISRREVEVAQLRYETRAVEQPRRGDRGSGLLQAEGRRIQALADSAVAGLRLRAVLGIFNPRTDMTGSTPVLSSSV